MKKFAKVILTHFEQYIYVSSLLPDDQPFKVIGKPDRIIRRVELFKGVYYFIVDPR